MTAGREQDARETLGQAMSPEQAVAWLEPWPCCSHCPDDDPVYHAENPPNSHDVPCPTCLRAALLPSPPATTGAGEALDDFVIVYEVVLPGTEPLAVLVRKSDGQPVLALSAGTTLDRIVAASSPPATDGDAAAHSDPYCLTACAGSPGQHSQCRCDHHRRDRLAASRDTETGTP